MEKRGLMMSVVQEKLGTQTVTKSFFQYFIPAVLGMMLLSINIVIDGIFIGNGVGSVALASVNVASPYFSVIISITLLIGIGGGTLYSMAMGRGDINQAQKTFTVSMLLVVVITIMISIFTYLNLETTARIFGANDETMPYVLEYMLVLLAFSLVIGLETCLSIFVRNDGNPRLAMISLILSSLINIVLNYWMIFILDWEVFGAALATVLATLIGLLILATHFFKKGAGLKFVKFNWNIKETIRIITIGFPSFLSEVGIVIFVVGYNIMIAYYAGTQGLAAFSVINYIHTFTFLLFIGIGSSIQPMISYYYGAGKYSMIQETIKIAEKAALIMGVLFIFAGMFGAELFVKIFGITSPVITDLATRGIRLFFIGYLFMGINFIYTTYYQSTSHIRPSIGIIIFRGFILLIALLYLLPLWLKVDGIWLALPIAEALVAIFLIVFARKGIMNRLERGYAS